MFIIDNIYNKVLTNIYVYRYIKIDRKISYRKKAKIIST